MGRHRKNTPIKIDGFRIAGLILALWAVANTYVDIDRYGISQGFYWWFCNLALIGISVALLFRVRDLLIGWISIACFTQVFWVIDNLYRTLTGENLFGLVEFMYQPGLPIDEFVLTHYHYFSIPIAVLALFYFEKSKRSYAWLWVAIVNPFIFGVSYFVFPPHQNVNCIHEPCFPGLNHWAGPLYSFLFWFIIFMVHLAICRGLTRFFATLRNTPTLRNYALRGFAGITLVSIALAVLDTQYKVTLPSFRCDKAELKAGESVSLNCNYTLDYVPNVMLLSYRAVNLSHESQRCATTMIANGKPETLATNVVLSPFEERDLSIPIDYPKTNTRVRLQAVCESGAVRDIANK